MYTEEWQRFVRKTDRAFEEISEAMRDIPSGEFPSRHYSVAQRVTELRSAADQLSRACKDILEYM